MADGRLRLRDVREKHYLRFSGNRRWGACVCVCENVAKISLISKFFDFSIIEFVPQEKKHILKFPNPQIL